MVISQSPVSIFLSPGFLAKTYFAAFSKQSCKSLIFFIYYILWNEVTLDNFLSFHSFSSHPYLYCHAAFGKKTFSPSCTAFQIRGTAMHTWHAVKSLNISKFGNCFSGWLWTVKKKIIFKIWPHLLLQSDLLTLQIVFVRALTRQIWCKFRFPWNFSFSLTWGRLWTLIFLQKFLKFYRNSNLFSYMDFRTECMTIRKKCHFGHINHEKNLLKYNLNITLLKNLILLSMLFFKAMQLTTNFPSWTAWEGPQ